MVCSQCSNRSGALKCSRCKMMTYCNRECQAAHWPVHKKHCKPIQLSPKKLELHFTVNKSTKSITFFGEYSRSVLSARRPPRAYLPMGQQPRGHARRGGLGSESRPMHILPQPRGGLEDCPRDRSTR
ncbi:hypothetical protein DFH08DRAFT_134740 [Mycena albidolilacea]|uniref:MYND-type domain-containing protein n=1 Tax=Mycena albidolilacea TaxID=1033008 RepID=A0AAD7A3Z4_9AGAR|nr:hypothetical protein DFH08DRAFT_134740 [Mycena albidolilacea]